MRENQSAHQGADKEGLLGSKNIFSLGLNSVSVHIIFSISDKIGPRSPRSTEKYTLRFFFTAHQIVYLSLLILRKTFFMTMNDRFH